MPNDIKQSGTCNGRYAYVSDTKKTYAPVHGENNTFAKRSVGRHQKIKNQVDRKTKIFNLKSKLIEIQREG